MGSVETGYLMELQFLAEGSIDIQFQAWLAISFGVVVATYTGRKELSMVLRVALAIIYVMAAYALYARWMSEVVRLDIIQAELSLRGLDLEPIMFSAWARISTYWVGSAMTIVSIFMFREDKSIKDSGA
jgi:hypothetical protein